MLVYDENVPRHFWKTAIVTKVLPSKDSEIKEAIAKITKTNASLKRPVNKFLPIENSYNDTNETDKVREQKLRREAAVIVELKGKCEC